MNTEKIGLFISELRKSRQMTQKDLAEKLNISDKAISKWERGLSCPDISLLLPLSEILGVTITELLNGERKGSETINVETTVVNALEYGVKAAIRKINFSKTIWAAAFSIFLLLGIIVVSIVDVAISGEFTWSLIPICACVFAWPVLFPAIKFGSKGILPALVALCLFIAPFLYGLDFSINRFTGINAPIFYMGIRIAPLSLIYCWVAFLLFKKTKISRLLVIATLVLLACPLNFSINLMIAGLGNQPFLSVQSNLQTVLNVGFSVAVALTLIIVDFVLRGRRKVK